MKGNVKHHKHWRKLYSTWSLRNLNPKRDSEGNYWASWKSKPLPLLSSNLVQTQFISQLAEQTNKGPPPYHKPWSHTLLMATYNFKELNFSRLISSCLKSSLLNSSDKNITTNKYRIHLSKNRTIGPSDQWTNAMDQENDWKNSCDPMKRKKHDRKA